MLAVRVLMFGDPCPVIQYREGAPIDHTTFATMASESIEERFKKAVWIIRNGPKIDSTNEQKLTFYSYFKQVGRHAPL